MHKPDAPEFESVDFEACDFEAVEFTAPTAAVDPLAAVEYTGDPERDSVKELAAVKGAFALKAAEEKRRQLKATDSEYWVCLCFQSREQVEEFLRNSGWGRTDDKYLDGQKVAKKIGVSITVETTGFGKIRIDQKLADLAKPIIRDVDRG